MKETTTMASFDMFRKMGSGIKIQLSRLTARKVIIGIIVFVVLGGAIIDQTSRNGTSIAAYVKGAVSALPFVSLNEDAQKLSTAGDANSSDAVIGNKENSAESGNWNIRKSAPGESIWSFYEKTVAARDDIAIKNQVVNGLKNLTVLKNGIAAEQLGGNSLRAGKEYAFLSEAAQERYIGKLLEVNQKLKDGVVFSSLAQDLQTTYFIANAPSYQFLTGISGSDTQQFLE